MLGRLEERNRRKQFVLERNLLDLRTIVNEEKKLSKAGKGGISHAGVAGHQQPHEALRAVPLAGGVFAHPAEPDQGGAAARAHRHAAAAAAEGRADAGGGGGDRERPHAAQPQPGRVGATGK